MAGVLSWTNEELQRVAGGGGVWAAVPARDIPGTLWVFGSATNLRVDPASPDLLVIGV